MDFGIGYFPTADAVGPGELAAWLEERGFESLVFAEHTHIAASRESPYPGKLFEAGTRRVSWWLPSAGRSVIEPRLERIEKAIAGFTGEA